MIFIEKEEEPEYLVEFRRKFPTGTYDSSEFEPFRPMLRERLVKEQRGLCAYCCRRITFDSAHNEHIEPRHMRDGSFSKRSLDYDNIVASCNGSTCAHHKGNEYDEKRFVSPLQADCEQRFRYDPDGFMRGDEYTIDLLDLNAYSLRAARKAVYKSLEGLSGEDIKLIYAAGDDGEYYPFSNVIFWVLERNGENRK